MTNVKSRKCLEIVSKENVLHALNCTFQTFCLSIELFQHFKSLARRLWTFNTVLGQASTGLGNKSASSRPAEVIHILHIISRSITWRLHFFEFLNTFGYIDISALVNGFSH